MISGCYIIFGVPKAVRTDAGGENVDVWVHMCQHRSNLRSVINVCIERLWQDMGRAVITVYRGIFYSLESDQVLDPENDIDLFCLHEVFVPRINESLRNMTPLQLFHTGLLGTDEEPVDANQHQLPTANGNVEVPNNPFVPCTVLKTLILSAL